MIQTFLVRCHLIWDRGSNTIQTIQGSTIEFFPLLIIRLTGTSILLPLNENIVMSFLQSFPLQWVHTINAKLGNKFKYGNV